MEDTLAHWVDIASIFIEGAGVGIIVLTAAIATGYFFVRWAREDIREAYSEYRHALGRGILLGLEFLVAGDIIRTVAVSPTLESVTVLAVIVAVRTFLSMTLEVELEGHWPWQRSRS